MEKRAAVFDVEHGDPGHVVSGTQFASSAWWAMGVGRVHGQRPDTKRLVVVVQTSLTATSGSSSWGGYGARRGGLSRLSLAGGEGTKTLPKKQRRVTQAGGNLVRPRGFTSRARLQPAVSDKVVPPKFRGEGNGEGGQQKRIEAHARGARENEWKLAAGVPGLGWAL